MPVRGRCSIASPPEPVKERPGRGLVNLDYELGGPTPVEIDQEVAGPYPGMPEEARVHAEIEASTPRDLSLTPKALEDSDKD